MSTNNIEQNNEMLLPKHDQTKINEIKNKRKKSTQSSANTLKIKNKHTRQKTMMEIENEMLQELQNLEDNDQQNNHISSKTTLDQKCVRDSQELSMKNLEAQLENQMNELKAQLQDNQYTSTNNPESLNQTLQKEIEEEEKKLIASGTPRFQEAGMINVMLEQILNEENLSKYHLLSNSKAARSQNVSPDMSTNYGNNSSEQKKMGASFLQKFQLENHELVNYLDSRQTQNDRHKSENRQTFSNQYETSQSERQSFLDKNSIYKPTLYLRNDFDDGQSENTFKSALNQFQSHNTSFMGGNQTPLDDNGLAQSLIIEEEEYKQDSPFSKAKDIEEIDIQVEIMNEDEMENSEWQRVVKEAKDTMDDGDKNKGKKNQKDKKQAQKQPIKRTYLRQYIKAKGFNDDYLQFGSDQLKQQQAKHFLNSENPLLLEDNILFILLIGNKSFHSYILSDQEANRCRIFFKKLIQKSEQCHEAYFGLAKIYYHLRKYEYAIDCIKRAVQIRPNDHLYHLWKGLILYYYIMTKKFTQVEAEHQQIRNNIQECEESLSLSYRLNQNQLNIAAFYLLLKITIYIDHNKQQLKMTPLRKQQDYALKIAKADKYMGYIAWSEIYLNQKGKVDLGKQVLADLTKQFPDQPQAYLRIWNQEYLEGNINNLVEIAERLFIFGTAFSSYEIRIIITLLYAKSLFLKGEHIRCFDLLQSEYVSFPMFTSLLYTYGKYAIQSQMKEDVIQHQKMPYFGSAVGALEECLRGCVKERHSKINYYIGKAYYLNKVPFKAHEYWNQSINGWFPKGTSLKKKKEMRLFLDQTASFFNLVIIIDKQIKLKTKKQKFKSPKVNKNEAQQYLNSLYGFRKQDPSYTQLYKALLEGYLLKDEQLAKASFERLISEHPFFIEGYHNYWMYIASLYNKQKTSIDLLNTISLNAMTKCENTREVPTSLWVETRIIRSKTLLLGKNVEEAINVLREICYILPPFPIADLSFVNEAIIEIENKQTELDYESSPFERGKIEPDTISFENNDNNKQQLITDIDSFHSMTKASIIQMKDAFQEYAANPFGFEHSNLMKQNSLHESMPFQSLHHSPSILEKTKEIEQIKLANSGKKSLNFKLDLNKIYFSKEKEEDCIPNGGRGDDYQLQSTARKSIFNNSLIGGGGLTNRKKNSRLSMIGQSCRKSMLESYISVGGRESMINMMTQGDFEIASQIVESEGFAIYSNVKFLYAIGKIAYQTGKFLEEGLKALDDFLQILEFYRFDFDEKKYDLYKIKAHYCIGAIFFISGDYEMSQQYLSEILLDLEEKGLKEMFQKAQTKLAKIYRMNTKPFIYNYFK